MLLYANLSKKVSETRIKKQENVRTSGPEQANIRQDRMFVYQENCFFNQNTKTPFQGRNPLSEITNYKQQRQKKGEKSCTGNNTNLY